jgi:hypothetical protein
VPTTSDMVWLAHRLPECFVPPRNVRRRLVPARSFGPWSGEDTNTLLLQASAPVIGGSTKHAGLLSPLVPPTVFADAERVEPACGLRLVCCPWCTTALGVEGGVRKSGYRTLEENQKVGFDVTQDPTGSQAERVIRSKETRERIRLLETCRLATDSVVGCPRPTWGVGRRATKRT